MVKKYVLTGILLTVTLIGMVPALTVAAPEPVPPAQDTPTQLLKNPGFEGLSCNPGSKPGWCEDNWTHDAYDGSVHENIFTPQGWVTWWREGSPYGQPEVKTIPRVPPFTGEIERIRSGNYALLMFTFYRLQDTGLYQVVTGLQPGATVEFSAHAHGWSCDNDAEMGYSCGDPWNQVFQVGIEPNGSTNAFSPSVIWSTEQQSPDKYRRIGPVTAQVGEGGTVGVFLRSKTKWGYKYQDAYWDDASLIMVSPGVPPTNTPPPPPPPPTAGPSPTPRPTPTPRPDGAIVHIVEAGDTIFGIALMYGVEPDQIRQLNAGSIGPNDLIRVGQELVITIPSQTPVPTPLPEPPSPTPETVAEGGNPGAPSNPPGAAICVAAFHDRDSNLTQDTISEELLPNAEFTVANAAGVVNRYISDGYSEPYCFTGLAAGSYRVIQNPPPGYTPNGSTERDVAVAEGTRLDLAFGNVRSDGSTGAGTPGPSGGPSSGEDEGGSSGGSTATKILSAAAKVSGVLVLLLAAGMAVLFVVNRRRM